MIIAGAVVLVAVMSVTRFIRRFLFAFSLAAAALLLLHMRTDPVEAGAALAAMGGGLGFAGPFRRMLMRGFL